MAALEPGAFAPEIKLKGVDGKTYSVKEALLTGPVLLAFYKEDCRTCQLTMPFLERLWLAYKPGFHLWAVSQDDKAGTRKYASANGLTYTFLLDDRKYTASNAYGLTSVPSIFLVDLNQVVQRTLVGFSKRDLNELAAEVAELAGGIPMAIVRPEDNAPEFQHE